MDGEGKSDSSPERETAGEDESKGGESCKKRKRKPYRPGENMKPEHSIAELITYSRLTSCF